MKTRTFTGTIIAGGICFAVLIAYGAWYAVVNHVAAEAAAVQTQIREREAAGGRAAAARQLLETLATQEAELNAHVVSTNEIVPFLESLESTGDGLGAQVDVVSVGNAPDGNGRIPLSLSIEGSFDAVLRTLGAIEYQPYDVRLTSLAFDTPTGEAATGRWTAAATFSVGMRTAPATAPAAELAPAATSTATSTATPTATTTP